MIRAADHAMYESKRLGKNRVVVAGAVAGMDKRARRTQSSRRAWERAGVRS